MGVRYQGLIDGDWPIATEIELLKRVQAMHSQLDEKIRNLTQELKTNRLYPRKVRCDCSHVGVEGVVSLMLTALILSSCATGGLEGTAHPLVSHVHATSAV